MIYISILNIISYFVLKYTFKTYELIHQNQQLQRQIYFQAEKYQQLNAAYRDTRSIVHDIKKHYFSIQGLLNHQAYDQLSHYLVDSISDLENVYTRFNTGNLVIDSLLLNYMNMANQDHIKFNTEINVDESRIPIDDYDLCIILGNLLDNSIEACKKIPCENKYINIQIYINNNNKFVIYIQNPIQSKQRTIKNNATDLKHGFGLKNVCKVIEKNHGLIRIIKDETFEVYVVLPIIITPK